MPPAKPWFLRAAAFSKGLIKQKNSLQMKVLSGLLFFCWTLLNIAGFPDINREIRLPYSVF